MQLLKHGDSCYVSKAYKRLPGTALWAVTSTLYQQAERPARAIWGAQAPRGIDQMQWKQHALLTEPRVGTWHHSSPLRHIDAGLASALS